MTGPADGVGEGNHGGAALPPYSQAPLPNSPEWEAPGQPTSDGSAIDYPAAGYPPGPYPPPAYGPPAYPPPTYAHPPYPAYPMPVYPPPAGYGNVAPGSYPPGFPGPYLPAPGPGSDPSGPNQLAVWSLVCSVAGIFCGFLSIIGVVLGISALKSVKQTGQPGRGLAIAGIAVGAITISVSMVVLISAILGLPSNG